VDELLQDMVEAGYPASAGSGSHACRQAAAGALGDLAERRLVTRAGLGDGMSFCYATGLSRGELAAAVNVAERRPHAGAGAKVTR